MRELDGLTRNPAPACEQEGRGGAVVLLLTAGLLVPATRPAVAGFLVWAAIICAYFAPSAIAHQRKVPNQGSVAVVNFFLGWTVIGWIIALAMALRDPAR
jgi:hypothetical protein